MNEHMLNEKATISGSYQELFWKNFKEGWCTNPKRNKSNKTVWEKKPNQH